MISARELRRADLFYADLVGHPLPSGPGEALLEQQGSGCPAPPGSACAFFFNGPNYIRYNIATDAVDVSSRAIAGAWRLPAPEFQSDLDAAVNWGEGHVYFFKRAGYVRYNIATDMVDVGPVEISRYWSALPQRFQSNLDAAVNWGDGFAYFFQRDRCLRYEIATNVVDGPHAFSRFFRNLPQFFQSDIDSVVNWGNGFVYFFKNDRYLRYNIASNTVDVPSTEIAANWPALPQSFRRRIKAAVNWTFPCDLAGLMRAAGLTVTEAANWRTRGTPGCVTRVGVMMHHTVGLLPHVLTDIVTNNKANFFIDRAGALTVVAGGRANHAGKGAQEVLDEVSRGTAPTGTALARGLRDALVGNGHFYGFENENKGDGIQTWPEVQLDAMARGAAALCQLHCWPAQRVIAHAEWTRRKPDPRGVDMNDFRTRVASHF
jgi:hypothetical protein